MKQLRIDFRFEDMGLALKGSGRKVRTLSKQAFFRLGLISRSIVSSVGSCRCLTA